MRSRIVTLLAIPLVAFALLASGTASAKTDSETLLFHLSGQVELPKPASTDGATVTAETCFWDVYIFRADATGRISGRTEVSCNAVMAEIAAQVVLLINGSPRGDASITSGSPNTSFWTTRLTFPVACLSGINEAYGAVYVRNYAGYAASDFGYSASYITC